MTTELAIFLSVVVAIVVMGVYAIGVQIGRLDERRRRAELELEELRRGR